MSSNGGGGSNLLDMGLMIAAGVAAPELAPVLMEGGAAGLGLGATAATGITGAALSGAVAAATGQNVARSALMGGAGGALSGALAPAGDVVGGGAGGSLDTTGQAAGSSALNNPEAGSLVQGNITPQQLSQGVSSGLYTPEQAAQYGQAYSGAFSNPTMVNPGIGNATNAQMIAGGGINSLNSMSARPAGAYTPSGAIYTGGPLQKFKYDPNNYQPDVVTPPNPVYHAQYAQGGITSLATGGTGKDALKDLLSSRDAMDQYESQYQTDPATVAAKAQGGDYNAMLAMNKINNTPNANYAQGGITSLATGGNPGQFDTPLQNPQGYKLESTGRYDAVPSASDSGSFNSFPEIIAQALKQGPYLTMDVQPAYATGGSISTLGSYSDGGRLLKGPGDGMSDSIPAKIGKKQEARLAEGEFVVPADVVSGLGNGSTDAGAKHLYKMMDKVRHARTGRKSQGKQIKAEKYLPA